MEVASQGRVGPEGGGEATVFDTSNFYNQMYNIQKDIITERKKKQEDLKKQQETWNALLEDPGDVWQADFEYVNTAVNEYNDFIIDLRSKGIDPNNMDPSLMRKMKELEANIRRTTSAAKDNETYSNQSFNVLNQDKANKYNKEYATKWLKEYADPNKTPQERAKMRTESNPFKINYNMIEFIDNTIPKEEVVDKGRLKITSRNKEAHRGLVLDFIMNDPSGQDVFESLKKPGEDEIAFAERVATEGQKRYPAKEDRQVTPQPRQTQDGFKGGYGTGNWNDKLNISADNTAPTEYFSSGVNKIKVTRAGTNDDLPPVSGLVDDAGFTMESFRPSVFFMGKDGKVSVFGYEYDEEGNPKDANGKFIDYTKNKSQLESQMSGFDIEQEFANRRSGKTSEKTKQIKRSEIADKAKKAGYTQAEYEKLLIQKGVKIVD
jgi:hypothetical protein